MAWVAERLGDNGAFVVAAFAAWALTLIGLVIWVRWRRKRLNARLEREDG